jgi:aminoglycoside/choline kinase family phosphotransferase
MPGSSTGQIDRRLDAARSWAADRLQLQEVALEPVSGDASFRRYFRARVGTASYIVMDAPPEHEDSAPFLDIAARLRASGLHAPEILFFDLAKGFGLLEDLGDELYRKLFETQDRDKLFQELFAVLERMARATDPGGLPPYDDRLLQEELDLFIQWYLGRHKNRPLNADEYSLWEDSCLRLKASCAEQPQVFVHRDFHSCNLLRTSGGTTGVIDFQDAVKGPLSYDLVSLLWDRYIAWPRERLLGWMEEMHARLGVDTDLDDWVRCCDWMSLQRNLKIVGIFARLHYRDNKQGYLGMIPQFYRYVLDVLEVYPEFEAFRSLLEQESCAP